MTWAYRHDRADGRGKLNFRLVGAVKLPWYAPDPRNEVLRRAVAAGHIDRRDRLFGDTQPDARPVGPVIDLFA